MLQRTCDSLSEDADGIRRHFRVCSVEGGDVGSQRDAWDVLRYDEWAVLHDAELEDLSDVRMPQRRDEAKMALQLLEQPGIVSGAKVEELHGDRALKPRVATQIQVRHGAARQKQLNAYLAKRSTNPARHGGHYTRPFCSQ
jgi:hypothetical protein